MFGCSSEPCDAYESYGYGCNSGYWVNGLKSQIRFRR